MSGLVVTGGSAGPMDSFYLLMNLGLPQHSVVKAHRYQPVMYFGMTWCPFQNLQDVLYALLQVECAEVETSQPAFLDKAPGHFDSQ